MLDYINHYAAVFALVLNAFGLGFIYRYVRDTGRIADQATKQTEAIQAPAVICEQKWGTDLSQFRLHNVGHGPALNLEWWLPGRQSMPICCGVIAAGRQIEDPQFQLNESTLKEAEEIAGNATVFCKYESLSGIRYESHNRFDFRSHRFVTLLRRLN